MVRACLLSRPPLQRGVEVHFGWTVGGGIRISLTANNLVVGLEYCYVDLGKARHTDVVDTTGSNTIFVDVDAQVHVACERSVEILTPSVRAALVQPGCAGVVGAPTLSQVRRHRVSIGPRLWMVGVDTLWPQKTLSLRMARCFQSQSKSRAQPVLQGLALEPLVELD